MARMKHFHAVLPLSQVAQGFKISESHETVGKVVISVSNSTDV